MEKKSPVALFHPCKHHTAKLPELTDTCSHSGDHAVTFPPENYFMLIYKAVSGSPSSISPPYKWKLCFQQRKVEHIYVGTVSPP